jgi:hypothetical protein
MNTSTSAPASLTATARARSRRSRPPSPGRYNVRELVYDPGASAKPRNNSSARVCSSSRSRSTTPARFLSAQGFTPRSSKRRLTLPDGPELARHACDAIAHTHAAAGASTSPTRAPGSGSTRFSPRITSIRATRAEQITPRTSWRFAWAATHDSRRTSAPRDMPSLLLWWSYEARSRRFRCYGRAGGCWRQPCARLAH